MKIPIRIQNKDEVILDSDVYVNGVLMPDSVEVDVTPNSIFSILVISGVVDSQSNEPIYREYSNTFTVYDETHNYEEIVITLIAIEDTEPYSSFYAIKMPCSNKVCYYYTSNSNFHQMEWRTGDGRIVYGNNKSICHSYKEYGVFKPKLFILKFVTEIHTEIIVGIGCAGSVCCYGCTESTTEIEVPTEVLTAANCSTMDMELKPFIPSVKLDLLCDTFEKVKTDKCCEGLGESSSVGISEIGG